jgi:hypothetical protein
MARTRPLIALLEVAAGTRASVPFGSFEARRLEWALTTGLGPLLFEAVKHDPEWRRSAAWRRIEGAALTARVVTGTLLEAAGDVLDACARRGLPVTLLKGISVCEQLYPAPYLRLMRDIDLLFDDDVRPAAEVLLRDLGWEPRSPHSEAFYAGHHHSTPLFHPRRNVWIEVHRRLMPPESTVARDGVFAPAHVRGEIRPMLFRGRNTTMLSAEMQLVYIAVHWGRHFHALGGLFALLDTIHLLRAAGARFAWDRTLAWLRDSAAAAHLYVLLTYLVRSRLARVAPAILRELGRSQHGIGAVNLGLAHRLIDTYMVDGRAHGLFFSEPRVTLLWRTLLAGGSASRTLTRIPGAMLRGRRWRVALGHRDAPPVA